MKIGIDCRIFTSNFTGIGRYVYELTTRIIAKYDKTEHEVVIFLNKQEFQNFNPKQKNVKKVLVSEKHYSLGEQTTFLLKIRKENLDIMFFPHFNVPYFYRRPYIVTIHDMTLSFFPGNKMNKFYHRMAYNMIIKNAAQRSCHVIAVSKNTKKDIINVLNIKTGKVQVIYNGVSKTMCTNIDSSEKVIFKNKFNITKPFILYTGVWRSHKNLPQLIRAFNLIKNKTDAQLMMTGKPDPLYPETQNLIKEYKLQNRIITPGFISEKDLELAYACADLYVMPSLYEGFGLPPLEAMKCGTPVAASNISSIPEVCGKHNAIFFNPEDTNEIANAILIGLNDKTLRKELIQNGEKRVKEFTWDKSFEETVQLIEKYV